MDARHSNPSLTKDPNDPRSLYQAFRIYVLVTVEENLRASALDVSVECFEAYVHVVVPLMDQMRRIVRHENIHGRKILKGFFDFLLFVKVIAFRFITPRAIEPAEFQPVELVDSQMQVLDP